MQRVFVKHFSKAADDLGCDKKCVRKAFHTAHEGGCWFQAMSKCDCGSDGAFKIDYSTVNTAAIVERTFGNVANLSQSDSNAIKSAVIRLQHVI